MSTFRKKSLGKKRQGLESGLLRSGTLLMHCFPFDQIIFLSLCSHLLCSTGLKVILLGKVLGRKGVSGISKFSLKYIVKKTHLTRNKLLTLRKFITSLEGFLKHFTANLTKYFIKIYQKYYLNKNT